MTPELDSFHYVSLPKSMKIGNFHIRPDIMLPIEPGGGELSWEMIVSGMLKVLAHFPEHEHADYYRSFVFAIEPDIARTLSSAGIVKAQNRDWELAEELFLALVGLEPNNPRALLNLALMYDQCSEDHAGNSELQKAHEEKAFRCYIRALQTEPEIPESHLYAGYFFLRQKSYGRARKEFLRFMETSDNEEKRQEITAVLEQLQGSSERDALFNEAFDFIRLGQETQGLEKISAFLEMQPDLWNAWFLKGWALRRLGQISGSISGIFHGPFPGWKFQ